MSYLVATNDRYEKKCFSKTKAIQKSKRYNFNGF